jgi:hypothetical protein
MTTIGENFRIEAINTFLQDSVVGIGQQNERADKGLTIGSGTLVETPSGRCAILTANHVVEDAICSSLLLAHRKCRVGITDFAVDVISHPAGLDVALLTVRDNVVDILGDWAIPIDMIADETDDDANPEDILYVVGFPHEYVQQIENRTFRATPIIYLTNAGQPPRDQDNRLRIQWNEAVIPQTQESFALPRPHGVSGSAIWRLRSTKKKIWTARNFGKIIGIERAYLKREQVLYAEPAGKWVPWFLEAIADL